MHLDTRLSLIASLVRGGSRLADIGTDHAHIPVWLVGQGICLTAVATDIRKGPAARAAQEVAAAGLADRISVRLGDGLSPVLPTEVDDIVIAGMGGENIASILKAAPWTQDERLRLVLQPMSKPEVLREFLLKNGFALVKEPVATDGDRYYTVICARYDPETALMQLSRRGIFYRGVIDPVQGGAYLEKLHARLNSIAAALRESGDEEGAERMEEAASYLV